MDNDKDELLTLKKSAEMLGVSTQTLRRWDHDGKLKAVRVGFRGGKGDRRFRKKDIEDHLKRDKK